MKRRLFFIPNYGNDKFVTECVRNFDGVISDCIIYDGPFFGCDVPVFINIEYPNDEVLKNLLDEIKKVKTDDYWAEGPYSWIK